MTNCLLRWLLAFVTRAASNTAALKTYMREGYGSASHMNGAVAILVPHTWLVIRRSMCENLLVSINTFAKNPAHQWTITQLQVPREYFETLSGNVDEVFSKWASATRAREHPNAETSELQARKRMGA